MKSDHDLEIHDVIKILSTPIGGQVNPVGDVSLFRGTTRHWPSWETIDQI